MRKRKLDIIREGKGQFWNPPDRFTTYDLLEMKRLRDKVGLSMTEVGNQYGISRERVRQLIGNKSNKDETP